MNTLPFDKPGRFWRGNLHAHSTLSDGRMTPEAVCELYRREGYDFLALTDHFMERYNFPLVDTRPYRMADFTTILGAELHTGRTELGELWHILAVGLPLDFAPYPEGETGPQVAARALAAGAFVAAAHPNWYTLTEADILSLGKIHAIEVFNGIACDHNDRGESWHIADILLGRGKYYTACAADDFHNNAGSQDFGRGWVWVKSESLDPDALLTALKAGHYYASTGPRIHDIEIDPGNSITVRCTPAHRIWMTGLCSRTRRTDGNGIMEATFNLEGFSSPYCRITIRDVHGRQAWSNPIWLV
ncbi:MAG: CehA/McbA family metallohydrolase [Caldilineaceae bacterium]|nr:CehA/McbA family metallohydrolase [Caldilineaceae bacterium]